jgi:hypothetical protein
MLLKDEMRLWVPKKRRIFLGSLIAAGIGAVVALPTAAAALLLIPIVAGGYVEANLRVLRAAERRFRGTPVTDFARLDHPDRTPLFVRGRVRATRRLPALLSREPVVARRVDLSLVSPVVRHALVHVAAVAFELIDAQGAALPIEVGPSTLLWCRKPGGMVPADWVMPQLLELPFPAKVQRAAFGEYIFRVGEALIRDGDEIEIAGALSRAADGDQEAWGRDPAWGKVLGASADAPLMIRTMP